MFGFDLISAGGWLMLPIILCSVVALAIVIERFWTLRPSRIIPEQSLTQVWVWIKKNQLTAEKVKDLKKSS